MDTWLSGLLSRKIKFPEKKGVFLNLGCFLEKGGFPFRKRGVLSGKGGCFLPLPNNNCNIITRQVSKNFVQNAKCTPWGCSYTFWCRWSICSGRNRQGSTLVTSFEHCNIPYSTSVATSTTYIAVLPPVLNIFPVSCTFETQGGRPDFRAHRWTNLLGNKAWYLVRSCLLHTEQRGLCPPVVYDWIQLYS